MTSKPKIQLYSGVDGVINIIPSLSASNHDESAQVNLVSKSWDKDILTPTEVRWRSDVATFLSSLDVELHWLSKWKQNATTVLDPLIGTKSVSSIGWIRKFSDSAQSLKGVAIEELQAVNFSPFIWIDTEATRYANQFNFYNREDVLILVTNPSVGLEDEHMKQIQEFINKHA